MPADADAALTFRPATTDDLDSLVEIDRMSQSPWSRADFVDDLARTEPSVFVTCDRDDVVALAAVRVHGLDLDILNIAVRPDRRRLGLGRHTLQHLLRRMVDQGVKTVFLEVRAGNLGALELYRSMGFEETQRRRAFYRNPVEDAVLMSLVIGPDLG